jgi:phage gpG-like protein
MNFIRIDVNTTQALQSIAALPPNVLAKINVTRTLDKAAAVLLNRQRTRYRDQIDPNLVPWIPSKASLRRRLLGGTGTLWKTGRLFHSIQLHRVGENDRAISTDVPYARFHQTGQGVTMRMFLGFNADDQSMFERVVNNEVKNAVRELNQGL